MTQNEKRVGTTSSIQTESEDERQNRLPYRREKVPGKGKQKPTAKKWKMTVTYCNTAMRMQVGIFRNETIPFHFKEIPNTAVAVVIAIICNYVI